MASRKKKQGQDVERLMAQIKEAGYGLLGVQRVHVKLEKIQMRRTGPVAICPVSHEAYPLNDGDHCRNCQGETPYAEIVFM